MISTYLGNMTIVLKFPLTNAASTNGLHKYNGRDFGAGGEGGIIAGALLLGATGGGTSDAEENVGVEGLARLEEPTRWAERVIDRLSDALKLGNYYGEWKFASRGSERPPLSQFKPEKPT